MTIQINETMNTENNLAIKINLSSDNELSGSIKNII